MRAGGLRVTTGSRLHFGLLGWGGQTRRQFGGIGLMIDTPGNVVEIRDADAWSAVGPLAGRVLAIARQVAGRLGHHTPLAFRISAPAEHCGLGTGTQISLAVARAVAIHARQTDYPDADELADWTGRGRRSGIGLHGFRHGGLLVDGGRRAGTDDSGHGIPPLLARVDWPEHWSILTVIPPAVEPGLHGAREIRAFDELPPISGSRLDRIARLVLMELLPALVECDLKTFGAALEELQQNVGAAFAPAQGGVYAEPVLARVAATMREAGLLGVGQSSWGPTLYGISESPAHERERIAATLRDRLDLPADAQIWTRGRNIGAHVERIE